MDLDSDSILYFIDELKSEDLNTRLHAVNSLDLIAAAIGEEKTCSELIPFISELVEDENEEVLLALASKISELPAYLGDSVHIPRLLLPLTSLCTSEEVYVQQRAIISIQSICEQLSLPDKIQNLISIIDSLANSTWCSGRIAACSLFLSVFNEISLEEQERLLDLYIKMGCDESPAVRKAAAGSLGAFVSLIENEKLLRLFRNLIEDENECVRQMTLKCAGKVVQDFNELVVIMQKFACDKSWRIRYSLLENIDSLIEKIDSLSSIGKEILALVKDSEAEVRALCLSQLPSIFPKLPKDLISSELIPTFEALSNDSSYHVRQSLMEALCKVAKFIDPSIAMQKLFPLINTLIRDDNFEVRMKFAENFALFNQGIGPNRVISFSIPINMQMMNDPRWRIRLKVAEALPAMANILGVQVFTEQLSAPLMKWVEDPVFGVREAAIQAIFSIANNFGKDWTKAHILPLIEMLVQSKVFTKRMTALKAINQLAELFDYHVLSLLLQRLALDNIPNIRFNVMKTVKNMAKEFKIGSELMKIVEKLKADSDPDVRYFAGQTFEVVNNDN